MMGVSSPSSNIIFSPPLDYQDSPTIDRGDSKRKHHLGASDKQSVGVEREAVIGESWRCHKTPKAR